MQKFSFASADLGELNKSTLAERTCKAFLELRRYCLETNDLYDG